MFTYFIDVFNILPGLGLKYLNNVHVYINYGFTIYNIILLKQESEGKTK